MIFSLGLIRNILAISCMQLEEFIVEWDLISIGRARIRLVLVFDFISLYFVRLVRLISGSVLIFRVSYIRAEKYFNRFICLILIFVLSIFALILSPNLIRLLLGWDGLGVTSYLLVIFYQRSKSYRAGIITALTNRLGDIGLLVSVAIMVVEGSWRFIYEIRTSSHSSALLVLIIVLSACTKRAQMPFSAWLPAAMAAPTPVSALVHSSTLVTAGVYLIIRIDSILVGLLSSQILLFMGSMTIFMAGLAAINEIDIKKIIALSTLRQLGVMIITLGINSPMLAYFHLLSHAFFKAILFMCAGLIIHNIKEYQDIRIMGSCQVSLPVTSSVIIIANLRLCGLPFISGFYSKDMILELILIDNIRLFIFSILFMGTGLTVMYSCRLRLLTGSGFIKSEVGFNNQEKDSFMLSGILILLPFSIGGGMVLSWNMVAPTVIYLPLWLKSVIIICIIVSAITIYLYISSVLANKVSILKWFFRTIWFMPYTLRVTSNYLVMGYSKEFVKISEQSWSEILVFKKTILIINTFGARRYVDTLNSVYLLKPVGISIMIVLYYNLF